MSHEFSALLQSLSKRPQIDAWGLQMAPQMTTFGTPKPPWNATRGQTWKKHEKLTKTGAHWDPQNETEIVKNTKKCVQKSFFKKDTKNTQIVTPPDLQNYGFRVRGASIFTMPRDT